MALYDQSMVARTWRDRTNSRPMKRLLPDPTTGLLPPVKKILVQLLRGGGYLRVVEEQPTRVLKVE